ncbi:MAG: DUF86 domain-containing protein [Sediminibacterium sp.]|jgi:uncharacterized protein with HEPN domain
MLDFVILDRLQRIQESIKLIEDRTNYIVIAKELVIPEDGAMLIDSIALRLQVIGEHVKKIDSLDPNLFPEKLQIDPDPIIRFRDFISHHYEKTDYEIIFDIIKNKLPYLSEKIKFFLKDNFV